MHGARGGHKGCEYSVSSPLERDGCMVQKNCKNSKHYLFLLTLYMSDRKRKVCLCRMLRNVLIVEWKTMLNEGKTRHKLYLQSGQQKPSSIIIFCLFVKFKCLHTEQYSCACFTVVDEKKPYTLLIKSTYTPIKVKIDITAIRYTSSRPQNYK